MIAKHKEQKPKVWHRIEHTTRFKERGVTLDFYYCGLHHDHTDLPIETGALECKRCQRLFAKRNKNVKLE